jgi:nitroreductase
MISARRPVAGLEPEASTEDALRWAVSQACLAPSELNSQPWRFRAEVRDDAATVELLLDETRLLPSLDPLAREAVVACGAALLNLRLALRGAALGTHVSLCPDPARPELLARLTVGGRAVESDEDRPLRQAIPLRGTHRGAFPPGDVPAADQERLVAEAAYEGAFAVVLDESATTGLAALTAEAEASLWEDGEFRREIASWARTNSSGAPDGVPGFAHGLSAWQSWLEPARVRASGRAASVVAAPLTLVVGSSSEGRAALLRAGSGLQRLLLTARTLGLSAGYLNSALHVERLRPAVGRVASLDHPQVVLRLGYTDGEWPTPRRSEGVVLDVRRDRT